MLAQTLHVPSSRSAAQQTEPPAEQALSRPATGTSSRPFQQTHVSYSTSLQASAMPESDSVVPSAIPPPDSGHSLPSSVSTPSPQTFMTETSFGHEHMFSGHPVIATLQPAEAFDIPYTTGENLLKRKQDDLFDDAPIDSVSRQRLSINRSALSQRSASMEDEVPGSSEPSALNSFRSQSSSTVRFFTVNDDGKSVQAAFWVQPEIKERTKLIRAINRHGGRISHSMSDCHYVVIRSSFSDKAQVKSAELGWKHGRTVIKPTWIEACVAAHDLVPIDDFVILPPVTPTKRAKAASASVTPRKTPRRVRAQREDSTTTLADPPLTLTGWKQEMSSGIEFDDDE
ncbi:hypothetical protein DACRYDRAFT_96449 [Dacryopinax primogenitus]|uniref:BRCT domain-containing protein n=1 Tax=Dacryopinax primogenitus (strain DJM 731) TaxID=1858805 RepID=M5FSC1_DACPD|nr:uncharacterized protein DACRYDRAFT_96449 [Dacryopinax primogenitus]EJT98713.1 hypothetical protein DACRYDRAFT_96449 [Dacryopinax primogenitus]